MHTQGKLMWFQTHYLIPPHKITREEQVLELAADMILKGGWDFSKPALVGYWDGYQVQLLTGTHRLAAAIICELKRVPVVVWKPGVARDAWGNEALWRSIIASGDEALGGKG